MATKQWREPSARPPAAGQAMLELPLTMRTAAVSYLVRPMELADIRQVMEVETESFPNTWPQTAFKRELQQNRLARYLVVVEPRAELAGRTQAAPPREGIGLRRLLRSLK